MSSRARKKSKSPDLQDDERQWSDWYWDSGGKQWYRTRSTESGWYYASSRMISTDYPGDYDYEYRAVEAATEPELSGTSIPRSFNTPETTIPLPESSTKQPSSTFEADREYRTQEPWPNSALAEPTYDAHDVPCSWPSCFERFRTDSDRDRHYRTVHANNGDRPYKCLVSGCQANVTSWTRPEKLRAHNNHWHGPYPCSVPGCSRGTFHGFPSSAALDEHRTREHNDYSSVGDFEASPVQSRQGNERVETHTTVNPWTNSSDFLSAETSKPIPNATELKNTDRVITKDSTTSGRLAESERVYKVHISKHSKPGRVFILVSRLILYL